MNRKQILKRMGEIAEALKADGADTAALETEFRSLQAALSQAELREEVLAGIETGSVETRTIDGICTPETGSTGTPSPSEIRAAAEKRGKELLEKRLSLIHI